MTPGHPPPKTDETASQVDITCPECAAVYRVAANLTGRRFQCRRCNHIWRWGERTGRAHPGSGVTHPGSDSNIGPLPDSGGLPTAGAAGGSSIIDTSWAGRRLGRYTLKTLLGRGGMGVVWRAHDPTLNRDIAVKILNQPAADAARGSLSSQLFLQEARAAAKLNHPGAITVFEIGEDAGHQFIAMELMHEGTLRERVDRDGPFEPRELFALMAPPARALALAHKRGIIHRDVKPGNLMFDDHGQLKLGDFGLSEVAGDPASLRMRGRAVGSLGWVAPETARGEPTTPASDVYAFGLVLLYALTGHQWLYAEKRSDLLQLHQNPPELTLDDIPGLTEDGMALLHRCLAREPADRFETADDLATFLEHCAAEPDEPVVLKSVVERTRRRTIVFSALAAVAAVALTVTYIMGYLDRSISVLRRPLRSHAPAPGEIVPPPRLSPSDVEERPATVPPSAPPAADSPPPDDAARADLAWPGKIDESTLRFISSKRGRVYHLPVCDGGRQIFLANLENYRTREEAAAAGKVPCPHCRPDRAASPPRP